MQCATAVDGQLWTLLPATPLEETNADLTGANDFMTVIDTERGGR
jgi:hypothetical protein